MSEQQKDETSPKPADAPKLDATTAAAALADAVTSAEKASGKHMEAPADKPAPGLRAARARALARAGSPKHVAQAATVAIAIGLVGAGATKALSGGKEAIELLPAWADAATAGIRQNHENIVRLSEDVRALRGVIEGFKASLDQHKIEAAGHNRPVLERLEDLERANQDATTKIVRLAEASDRIERVSSAAEAKLADIAGRLGKMERTADEKTEQDASDPIRTGSVPDGKSASKSAALEGWVLREVYGGGAVVEGRNGRLHDVVPGKVLPSVGRVEAIERRGRIWVVVTSKGIIRPPERWQ